MTNRLKEMYHKDYHNRQTMIYKIASEFRRSYCQLAAIALLGTLNNELLKVVYEKSYEWLPCTDDKKFSVMIKFLNERLED